MSNETNSEHDHWKDRLDQLNSLPGEVWTDKEASWERLYDKLKYQPARMKSLLYWKAAASVLLILGISLLIIREKRPHPAQTGRLPLPGTVSKVLIQMPIHTSPGTVSSKDQGKDSSKDPGTVSIKIQATDSSFFPVRRATIREAGSLAKNDQYDSATVPYSVSPPDTPAFVAITALPLPKKIRVVSINELDKPFGEGEPKEDGKDAVTVESHFLLPMFKYNKYYSDAYIEKQQSKDYLLQIKIHR
jgi:hypothetical protein